MQVTDDQTNWINSGREIIESHIEEIKDYFGPQKTQADRLDANFHKKNANQVPCQRQMGQTHYSQNLEH